MESSPFIPSNPENEIFVKKIGAYTAQASNQVDTSDQCDQIVRFITLWTTIQSLWQQSISPNFLHS